MGTALRFTMQGLILADPALVRGQMSSVSGDEAADPAETHVTLRYGFCQMGRFAVEYRRTFNDPLSQTLRRLGGFFCNCTQSCRYDGSMFRRISTKKSCGSTCFPHY